MKVLVKYCHIVSSSVFSFLRRPQTFWPLTVVITNLSTKANFHKAFALDITNPSSIHTAVVANRALSHNLPSKLPKRHPRYVE